MAKSTTSKPTAPSTSRPSRPRKKESADAQPHWYRLPDDPKQTRDLAKSIFSTCANVEADQAGRMQGYRIYSSLYRDKRVPGFGPGQWRFPAPNMVYSASSDDRPYTYNVIRSCTDTATAKICLSSPMPRYLPSVADEGLKNQISKIERFVWGVIMSQAAHATGIHSWRDGALLGDGYLYVRSEDGRIIIESLHPSCVIADDNSALNGDLRDLFIRNWHNRQSLIALFPDLEEELQMAPRDSTADDKLFRDMVKVVEGWHLPRGNDAGRHVIATGNAILVDEEWDCPRFPIVPIHWTRDLRGWHGTGLAEELAPIQLEINATIGKIAGNMEHLAVPYIAVPRAAKVDEDHVMTNEEYRLIRYDGGIPPQTITPPAAHPQVFEYLETLYKRAFEISGISLLSATSQKPAGLYSGVALINYIDIESVRFSPQQKAWEQVWIEVAKRIVDCAQRTPDLKAVNVVDDRANVVERIDPEDLEFDYDEDLVEVQIYPASSLPKTLAGRAQLAVELTQGGVFDRTQAAAVIGDLHPDIDKQTRLSNAPWDDLCMVMEHMLSKGDYIPPLEYQDCKLGIKLATRYWCRARVNGVPEERYSLLETWMADAAALLSRGAGQPPEPAPPPPPPSPTMRSMPAIPSPDTAPPPVAAAPNMQGV